MGNYRERFRGFITGIAVCGVIFSCSYAYAHEFGNDGQDKITVAINGYFVGINEHINGEYHEPFIYKERVYVPARTMAEVMGKEVEWDDERKIVNFKDPSYYTLDKKLISAFDGFNERIDGAYAEEYSIRIGELYAKNDKTMFIKVLSTYPKGYIDNIASLLDYNLSYGQYGDKQTFIKELEIIKNEKGLTSSEVYVAEKIMDNLRKSIL